LKKKKKKGQKLYRRGENPDAFWCKTFRESQAFFIDLASVVKLLVSGAVVVMVVVAVTV
jgi:hypothetical protein